MDGKLRLRLHLYITVFYLTSNLAETRLLHGPVKPVRPAGAPPPPAGRLQQHAGRPPAAPVAPPAPPARPLTIRCHPDSMEVVLHADLFDTGLRVDVKHLHLGSDSLEKPSECSAKPSGEEEYTIRAKLVECGIKLSSTEDKIIYSTVLVYSPESTSDSLLRLSGATIPVECHYGKKYSMDGISLQPTWVPYVSTVSTDDQIYFNLLLMSDDWKSERGSSSYFLGDPIRVEVAAIIGNHMPMKVYVEHCVATSTPDAEAALRYDFIENQGCLTDAYLTNSKSHFLPRVEDHKLRFQVEAFKFYQVPGNQVYITCYVKAVPVPLSVSSENRACSLIENRWRSVDGNDQACRSCSLSHPPKEPPATEAPKTTTTPRMTKKSAESVAHKKKEYLPSATYIRFRPGKPNQKPAELSRFAKRGTDSTVEKTIQLGPIIVLPSRTFFTPSRETANSPRRKSH